MLAKRIAVESERRYVFAREVVVVTDATPTGDPVLDDVLSRLAAAKLKRCATWIDRLGKGAENACWDRLIAKSLLRSDALTGDPARYVPDPHTVSAVTERVRAVLEQPGDSELRDVALVAVLAHAQSLFGLLSDSAPLTPAGIVRGLKAQRSLDRAGRQALERYKEHRDPALGAGDAEAIERIVLAAGQLKGSGPG